MWITRRRLKFIIYWKLMSFVNEFHLSWPCWVTPPFFWILSPHFYENLINFLGFLKRSLIFFVIRWIFPLSHRIKSKCDVSNYTRWSEPSATSRVQVNSFKVYDLSFLSIHEIFINYRTGFSDDRYTFWIRVRFCVRTSVTRLLGNHS